MIFSRGFTYRTGIRIKEFGERMSHVRVFSIPLFRWCCGLFIALGLSAKDSALKARA